MNDTRNNQEPKRDGKFTVFAIAIVAVVIMVLMITRHRNPFNGHGPLQPYDIQRATGESRKLGKGIGELFENHPAYQGMTNNAPTTTK